MLFSEELWFLRVLAYITWGQSSIVKLFEEMLVWRKLIRCLHYRILGTFYVLAQCMPRGHWVQWFLFRTLTWPVSCHFQTQNFGRIHVGNACLLFGWISLKVKAGNVWCFKHHTTPVHCLRKAKFISVCFFSSCEVSTHCSGCSLCSAVSILESMVTKEIQGIAPWIL